MKDFKEFQESSQLNEYFDVSKVNGKKFICPMDLYGHEVKKGEIFVQMPNEYYFAPERKPSHESGRYMPAEIVSTWEEKK